MTVSEKQLEANKQNAQKGGVKTPEGKEIVKYNALKHGLLAKEVVINVGEGAEAPEEFNALLVDLSTHLQPQGTLEEMLVEKIAVAYWRLRRAYRYEVGLIRRELDTATDDFYGETNWNKQKGVYCGRRTGTLYLASGGHYFGCRHCYNLSYESRNESRLGRFGNIGYTLVADRKIEELYSQIKRWTYKGKPTKKAQRLKDLERRLEMAVSVCQGCLRL